MVAPGQLAEGDLLTVHEVQQLTRLGRSTVYALCESGQLPHIRVHVAGGRRGRVLVARADLEAFLDRSRHGATQTPTRLDLDAIHRRVRERRGA